MCVQLVLSVVHMMQVFVAVVLGDHPPQTTNFPPGRRERLW